ncbi:hypothetical protein [Streptomyces hyaluromycini]|uniref:hypothetical protein n=1 Tax=Streptomyces hyaluromycini TaxID=1377993 RepID=UPI000B5CAE15|nr:hypothetical protein [Streptomyces hyaluromycini]
MTTWSEADATRYELAKDLLNAVIAVYSSRIDQAKTPEEKARFLTEQASYAEVAQQLAVTDKEAVLRVLEEYPQLLRSLRANTA